MRVHASILVQRPIAAVFAFLSTPAQLPSWVAGVGSADGPTSDQQEVGRTLVVQDTTRLDLAPSLWEVTAYGRLAGRSTSGCWPDCFSSCCRAVWSGSPVWLCQARRRTRTQAGPSSSCAPNGSALRCPRTLKSPGRGQHSARG